MSESHYQNKNMETIYEAQSDEKDVETGCSDLQVLTQAVEMLRKGGLFGLQPLWLGPLPQVLKTCLKYHSILDKQTNK